MPIYEYQCDSCEHKLEIIQKFKDEPRYQAVVQSVERRQEILRDRLPDTLQRLRVMQ